ncbi:MAG: hypothetical protein ACRYGK_15255 [Janthinobacterium lividum]
MNIREVGQGKGRVLRLELECHFKTNGSRINKLLRSVQEIVLLLLLVLLVLSADC